jgi:hypothetical protein
VKAFFNRGVTMGNGSILGLLLALLVNREREAQREIQETLDLQDHKALKETPETLAQREQLELQAKQAHKALKEIRETLDR